MIEMLKTLLGNRPFELPGDGTLVSCNCRGYQLKIECDRCKNDIDCLLWIIVDGERRPDLLKQIAEGSHHDPICPHCEHKNHIGSDLLLFRRNIERVLVFSPALSNTSAEEQMKVARSFLLKPKQQLGSDWKDEWYEKGGKRGIFIGDRRTLPVGLSLGM